MEKSILEAIFHEKAQRCLNMIVQKWSINLLELGSEGLPLGCIVLSMGVNDPFRQLCFEAIPALSSIQFYEEFR